MRGYQLLTEFCAGHGIRGPVIRSHIPVDFLVYHTPADYDLTNPATLLKVPVQEGRRLLHGVISYGQQA